ncbi:hypothetical protein NDU88_004691 [Pleurodeles waltl]|uniref:Uncharacterized protein n=1 Tax=Pleurodeles waltl TaxID=8319 RepID=A0AAV7M7U6_PLEWA|nr:hypothetical protein NDU88_004691 [Pleurodeles waltl]
MIRGPQEVLERCVTGGQSESPHLNPVLSEIMAAIHDLKGSLDPRLDAVVIDVGFLGLTFKKSPTKF